MVYLFYRWQEAGSTWISGTIFTSREGNAVDGGSRSGRVGREANYILNVHCPEAMQ